MLQLRPNCEWCDRDLPPAAERVHSVYTREEIEAFAAEYADIAAARR